MTGFYIIEIGETELLDMAEDIGTHVRFHPYTKDMTPSYTDIVEHRFNDNSRQHYAKCNDYTVEIFVGYVGFQQLSCTKWDHYCHQ